MNARFLRKLLFPAACSFSLVGLLHAAPQPNAEKIHLFTKLLGQRGAAVGDGVEPARFRADAGASGAGPGQNPRSRRPMRKNAPSDVGGYEEDKHLVLTPTPASDGALKRMQTLEVLKFKGDWVFVRSDRKSIYDEVGVQRYSCFQNLENLK